MALEVTVATMAEVLSRMVTRTTALAALLCQLTTVASTTADTVAAVPPRRGSERCAMLAEVTAPCAQARSGWRCTGCVATSC